MKNFKKLNFIVLAFLFGMFSYVPVFAQDVQDDIDYESLAVYLWDGSGKFTNFRNKPKGDIVGKISTEEIVTLAVDRVEKGWWHVVGGQAEVLDGDTKVLIMVRHGFTIRCMALAQAIIMVKNSPCVTILPKPQKQFFRLPMKSHCVPLR